MSMDFATQFAHWHQFFENTAVSPLTFYESLEQGLKETKVPDAATSRVDFLERGMLSAKRVYLEVRRDWLTYHICVAPFGTGFFVSTRLLVDRWRSRNLMALFAFVLFMLLLFIYCAVRVSSNPLSALFVTGFFGFFAALLFLVVLVSWIFRCLHMTYYRLDTMLAFHEAVHRLVVAQVNKVIEPSGRRPLSEEESKPVMHKLLRRE